VDVARYIDVAGSFGRRWKAEPLQALDQQD
jgi:hypothetical protein